VLPVAVENPSSNTCSECVFVALGIQHIKSMGLITSSVACLAVPYFFPHLINGTIYEKTLWVKRYVFWFSLLCLSETFLTLRRVQRDTSIRWGARWRVVEALRLKQEIRGFDSRWCYWIFSLTYSIGGKGGRCVALTTLPPSCAECLKIWEPQPPGTLRVCQGL
jgi:hypothetical protein